MRPTCTEFQTRTACYRTERWALPLLRTQGRVFRGRLPSRRAAPRRIHGANQGQRATHSSTNGPRLRVQTELHQPLARASSQTRTDVTISPPMTKRFLDSSLLFLLCASTLGIGCHEGELSCPVKVSDFDERRVAGEFVHGCTVDSDCMVFPPPDSIGDFPPCVCSSGYLKSDEEEIRRIMDCLDCEGKSFFCGGAGAPICTAEGFCGMRVP